MSTAENPDREKLIQAVEARRRVLRTDLSRTPEWILRDPEDSFWCMQRVAELERLNLELARLYRQGGSE